MKISAFVAVCLSLVNFSSAAKVYVGSYAGGNEDGIFVYDLDGNGNMRRTGAARSGNKPSYLAVRENRLYAIVEDESKINSFTINGGNLGFIGQQSFNGGPCHISLDHSGKMAMVANYGSGTLGTFPIGGNGALDRESSKKQHYGSGPKRDRQGSAHAHMILPDPQNKFAVAVDLGVDKIFAYRMDLNKKTLEGGHVAFQARGGLGPRHMIFSPNGKHAYLGNELDNSVTALNYDANNGRFGNIDTMSTVPMGHRGGTVAAVRMTPDGSYLYVSNRGHNSIAIFRVDKNTGRMKSLGHTRTDGGNPRDFDVDPSGNFLIVANQDSNNLVIFRINKSNGSLQRIGQVNTTKPTSVKIVA